LPRQVDLFDMGNDVAGVHVAQDQVWVDLRRFEARPIDVATTTWRSKRPARAAWRGARALR
jgi:hypothetical protein